MLGLVQAQHRGANGVRKKEDNVLSQTIDAATGMAAPGAGMRKVAAPLTSRKLHEKILEALNAEKAEDIVSIDLQGKSQIADYMLICSGRSSRQVTAIAEKLVDLLKHEAGVICRMEGKDQGDWVLVDAGDVIVHVFRPEVREFYQLEKMWMAPPISAGKPSEKQG